jgi:hypothetical protein
LVEFDVGYVDHSSERKEVSIQWQVEMRGLLECVGQITLFLIIFQNSVNVYEVLFV